jgi:pseudaminic acid synthase
MRKINIGNKFIGDEEPCFIIAEISANHRQNKDLAIETIKAACRAGADAIKLQTYTPDTITLNSDKEYFQVKVNDAWKGQTLYELYSKGYTPWEWHAELKDTANSYGVPLFSTPFDNTAVDFLEKLEVPIYKIASFEIVDIPLLKKVALTKKPVIVSTGMASLEEIDLAYKTLIENGTKEIILLKCSSSYPAIPEEMNLATISDLKKRFNTVIGLSDHTLTTETAIAAVCSEAKVIEKHFILDRNIGGPDSSFSLQPLEFETMVKQIRNVEKAIGIATYGCGEREKENYLFRKSLWVIKDIKAGEMLTPENVMPKRPSHGLAPKHYEEVLGKRAKSDIERATPLSLDLIE